MDNSGRLRASLVHCVRSETEKIRISLLHLRVQSFGHYGAALYAALSFSDYVSFQSLSIFGIAIVVQRRKGSKEFWLYPLLIKRVFRGTFYNNYDELSQDNKKFYNYYWMSVSTYHVIYHIRDYILRQDAKFRLCVCSTAMVCCKRWGTVVKT